MAEGIACFQRARGSVRLRVTLLAAGLFAVTLFAASALLLRALEQTLRWRRGRPRRWCDASRSCESAASPMTPR